MSAASSLMEAEAVIGAELDRIICERLELVVDQLDILRRLVETRTLTRDDRVLVGRTLDAAANIVALA